jgi:single-strand DNA-binding protein
MNVWTGTGRLTKDAVIRAAQETTVARFILAVNRKYKKDGENADFISCVAFGKTAEFIEKYTKKGMKVEIVGRIQTGSYEKDGAKVYTTDIIVETIDFAESKKAENKADDDFINVPFGTAEEFPFA